MNTLPSNIPAFGSIPDPKAAKNVKHPIRDAISDEAVFSEIAPYFINGGVCGHKVMDLGEAVNAILAYDKNHGNRIAAFNMNKKALGDQVKAVLRERYDLDKKWKIAGVSKRAQIAAPSAE